jgi:hypothetical protein
MRHSQRFAILLFGTANAIALNAGATQPPDIVQSDYAENTAMGNLALSDLTAGSQNTAAGQDALLSTTTGSANTA